MLASDAETMRARLVDQIDTAQRAIEGLTQQAPVVVEIRRALAPSLTTISPDKEWLADNAVGLLLERIAGTGEAARRDLTVPYTLEIRESTAG